MGNTVDNDKFKESLDFIQKELNLATEYEKKSYDLAKVKDKKRLLLSKFFFFKKTCKRLEHEIDCLSGAVLSMRTYINFLHEMRGGHLDRTVKFKED